MEEKAKSKKATAQKEKEINKEPLMSKGDEYLYATITMADWIHDSYKKFAEKYRNDGKILRELYLCFCDKVPIEVLTIAAQKEPVEGSFRVCRRKHMESEILKEHSNELEEIKHITEDMEADVKSMSGTVNYIAAAIPALDDLFSSNEIPEDKSSVTVSMPIKEKKSTEAVMSNENGKQKKHKEETAAVDDLPKANEIVNVAKMSENDKADTKRKKNKGKLITYIKMKLSEIISKYEKDPARFVIELYAKDYKDEQINFILDCIETGMKVSDIEKFADPKISVDMMIRLRDMQENKKKREVE